MNQEIKVKVDYCLNCKIKPCSNKGCPLNNDIPEFIKQVKEENYESVLVVAHSGVSKAFYGYFNGIPEDGRFLNLGLKNCEIKEYDL